MKSAFFSHALTYPELVYVGTRLLVQSRDVFSEVCSIRLICTGLWGCSSGVVCAVCSELQTKHPVTTSFSDNKQLPFLLLLLFIV